jgi:hypothetical protein
MSVSEPIPNADETAHRLRSVPPLAEVRRFLAQYRGAAAAPPPRVESWRRARSTPTARDRATRTR